MLKVRPTMYINGEHFRISHIMLLSLTLNTELLCMREMTGAGFMCHLTHYVRLRVSLDSTSLGLSQLALAVL